MEINAYSFWRKTTKQMLLRATKNVIYWTFIWTELFDLFLRKTTTSKYNQKRTIWLCDAYHFFNQKKKSTKCYCHQQIKVHFDYWPWLYYNLVARIDTVGFSMSFLLLINLNSLCLDDTFWRFGSTKDKEMQEN